MGTVLSKIPERRKGTGPEVADAVGFLLSRASACITGQTLVADGGLVDGGLSVVAPPYPEDLTPPLPGRYEFLPAPYRPPHR